MEKDDQMPDGMDEVSKRASLAARKYRDETETIVLNATDVDADTIIANLRFMSFAAGYHEGYSDALKWISVEEKLPAEGKRCLCVVKSTMTKFPTVWGWMGNAWSINVTDPSIGSHKTITHWMPLPQEPLK